MKKRGRIGAVTFDGDMTLWDFRVVMRNSLGITLEELRRRLPGEAVSELTVDKMIEIRDSVAAGFKQARISLEEIRFEAFRRTLDAIGYPDDDLASKLHELYLEHRFGDLCPYPDAYPVLTLLKPEFRLGLVSNGNGYPDRCGFAGCFDFVLFAQDVGFEKPDPRIFRAAAAEAGCLPSELVHVGDSLYADVAGANGVGAVSVWLNRDAAPNDGTILPDFEISTLTCLPDILRTVEGE